TPDGRNTLNRLAQDLSKQTIKSIRIVGHTDSIGSSQSNLSLSYARANSVAAYLASRGVNRQLINTQGLGETRPVANNRTTRGRALNRRVEITVKGAARIRIR
ncbi:MAG TPA: OmpA family protein, partial [Leucothrix sp.]|nr:OmpA family protein [Leucothrix sp.]